jgi:hypothetical protein
LGLLPARGLAFRASALTTGLGEKDKTTPRVVTTPPSFFRRFEVGVTEVSAAWWRSSFPFEEDQAIYLDCDVLYQRMRDRPCQSGEERLDSFKQMVWLLW